MRLDHIAIVAPDCTRLRCFFVEVAGLEEGTRPPFGVGGHWLYLDGRALLHLIERPEPGQHANADVATRRPPARIDHIALRIDSAVQWNHLLRRLRERKIAYQFSVIPALQQQQLFVSPVPNVTVEFVIETRHLAGTSE